MKTQAMKTPRVQHATRTYTTAVSREQRVEQMLHLRVVAPANLTARTLELLGDAQFVTNIVVFRGAALKPPGDVMVCNVASEEASNVIADLRELGLEHDGAIVVGPTETVLSRLVPEAPETEHSSDAVVWEEVEERTSESAELSGNFLAFMVIAVLIAAVGLYLDSALLIIGAMIVGPDFGPVAGVCVAAVHRRVPEAGRSLLALIVGYALGIVAAFFMTAALRAAELIPQAFDLIDRSMQGSITQTGFFPVLIALLAGTAGMLSLTTAKSGALIGVLVSVTTIPAAANIAVTLAYSQQDTLRASILQLATNVGAMLLAGVVTLAIQRALYQRRRAAHLRQLARHQER